MLGWYSLVVKVICRSQLVGLWTSVVTVERALQPQDPCSHIDHGAPRMIEELEGDSSIPH